MACRFCGSTVGEVVLDLGDQPACEYFPPIDAGGEDPVFPLRLWLCAGCALAQLADDAVLPDEPVGVEPTALSLQRADAVRWCAERGLLDGAGTVAEGPTPHGGSWLPGLSEHGIAEAASDAPADLVVDGSFGLMHAADQRAALAGLLDRLAPGGRLLFQFHSLAAILRLRQWNAVRLGHYAYYSTPSVVGMLARLGLTVESATEFGLYGGTVLLSATRGGAPDSSVAELVDSELAIGVTDAAALRFLQSAVDGSLASLRSVAERAKADGSQLYGYSAASRAVSLLYLARPVEGLVAGVADASPAKQGCRMPGTTVPIISPDELLRARPQRVVVFVPDLLPEVREALPGVERSGGTWLDLEALTASP
ncbi:class I SAM-dependent methyltransferase [Pseudonocardia kujensis]|uniref:class I SAM-dependent methyltransferase n=1 Tax=Pseudonocardia kujensis TaxID=1128675 RepID=UPI001E4A0DC8|nr:class I SAM-dependent methyltransferase [Pseudonocardia kujensis]MCE0763112.1 class I SAM-dependent methyltransferase [Pseudonocardia kujensis]